MLHQNDDVPSVALSKYQHLADNRWWALTVGSVFLTAIAFFWLGSTFAPAPLPGARPEPKLGASVLWLQANQHTVSVRVEGERGAPDPETMQSLQKHLDAFPGAKVQGVPLK